MKLHGALCVMLLTLPAMPAVAGQTVERSVAVPGFGPIHDIPTARERPDPKLRYRVVFSISKASTKPGEPNPSLQKVARFMNLLAHDGIRPAKGDIVAVAFGAATPALMKVPASTDQAPDPNAALIKGLQAAGVTIAICSQAMHAGGYKAEQLLPDVRVDDAAITTMANLQLRGFALIPD